VSKTRMGLLVSPRDPFSLATALKRIHEEEGLRQSLAGNALRALETDYSNKALALGAHCIYKQVRALAEPSSHNPSRQFTPALPIDQEASRRRRAD
jgi:hypothetical protein